MSKNIIGYKYHFLTLERRAIDGELTQNAEYALWEEYIGKGWRVHSILPSVNTTRLTILLELEIQGGTQEA